MSVRLIVDPLQPEAGTDNFYTRLIVRHDKGANYVAFCEPYDVKTLASGLRAMAEKLEGLE